MNEQVPVYNPRFERGQRIRCIKPTRLEGPIVGHEYTVFQPAGDKRGNNSVGLTDFANRYYESECFVAVETSVFNPHDDGYSKVARLLADLFRECDCSGNLSPIRVQRTEAVQELAMKLLGRELDCERMC